MRFSICIPTYKRGIEFAQRAIDSVNAQTFKDFELIVEEDTEGKGMAWNTNRVISQAKGELIKILYQDDYLAHENALQTISDNFTDEDNWLITACSNNLNPYYSQNNTLGSPSVLTIRNKEPLMFNDLKFFLDLDYYRRLYNRYGKPKIIKDVGIIIGLGQHQETNHLTQEEIQKDYDKYTRFTA